MKVILTILSVIVLNLVTFASEPKSPVATNIESVLNSIEYPLEARSQAIEGNVNVNFFVNSNGEILKFKVIDSCNPILEEAVLAVVNNLEFIPAKNLQGINTVGKITIPFVFKLDIN